MGRARSTLTALGVERLAAAVVLAGGLAVVAYAAWRLRATYVGDASVYLPYAENAAKGDPFTFNRGEFSSGSTSPLWGLLLGIPHLLGAGAAGVKVLSALAVMAGVLACAVAAQRFSHSWLLAAVAALFVLGTAAFPGLAMYESGLTITLSALALLFGDRMLATWRETGAPGRARWALVAVWAMLPLTRPDAVSLVAAHVVVLAIFAPTGLRGGVRTLAPLLALAAVPAALYFGYSQAELGTFSTSSQARAFTLQELARDWIGPLYLEDAAIRELVRSPWVLGLAALLIALPLLFRQRRWRWVAVYGGLAFLGYVALLTFVIPGFWDTPRYLGPIVPIAVCALAVALSGVARVVPLWATAAVALLVIGGTAVRDLRQDVRYARAIDISERDVFSRDVTRRLDTLGRPGDELLAYEVQLRYHLRDDMKVISLDGITDPRVAPYRPEGDMTGLLKRYEPRFWVADRNPMGRNYLQGSVLQRALTAFRSDPDLRERTLDGIRFRAVERRQRPQTVGFPGWEILFELEY